MNNNGNNFFINTFNCLQRLSYEQYWGKLAFAFRRAHSEIFGPARTEWEPARLCNSGGRSGGFCFFFFMSKAKS